MIRASLKWKILSRLKNHIDRSSSSLSSRLAVILSRVKAKKFREEMIDLNGGSVIDKNTKTKIKSYCSKRFGSDKHWPWIALYTEMRGEYIHGWIPADIYRFQLLKSNNPDSYSALSSRKCFDHLLFKGFSLTPILTRVSGIYYDSSNIRLSEKKAASLLEKLDEEVVMKKDGGRGGEGLSFINSREIVLKNSYVGQDLIIQPLVKQCRQLSDIHSESVNTLRVFTHLNSAGDVDILVTVLRFGIGGTRCDGIDAGGGFTRVAKDGIPEPVWYNFKGIKKGSKHPDSKIEIGKIKIPNTDLALKRCIEAHKTYPFVKFVGWDVAIDRDHKPVLLEWNARHPGFAFFEALFGPLLADNTLS